jgi:hypothetical protein
VHIDAEADAVNAPDVGRLAEERTRAQEVVVDDVTPCERPRVEALEHLGAHAIPASADLRLEPALRGREPIVELSRHGPRLGKRRVVELAARGERTCVRVLGATGLAVRVTTLPRVVEAAPAFDHRS